MSLSEKYVNDSDDSSDDEEVVYQAPRGYQKVSSFKTLPNLEKKEIWLIKAPKGFNFKNLQTLPISFNPLESGSEFKSDSKNYKIQEDLTSINIKEDSTTKYNLITPTTSSKLKFNKKLKINRFYNIKQNVIIPEINYGKVIKKRKNVKVVKGLAPQHFATGYGRTELDVTSDVEENNETTNNEGEENLTIQDEDVIMEDETPKKHKKEKKDKKDKKEKKDKKHKKEKK